MGLLDSLVGSAAELEVGDKAPAFIRALDLPVFIVRAKEPPPHRALMDFSSSPTWPGLVHEFRHGREVYWADRSHFLPMEIPRRIAEVIVAEGGLAG